MLNSNSRMSSFQSFALYIGHGVIERAKREVGAAKAASDFRSIPRHSALPFAEAAEAVAQASFSLCFDPSAVDIHIYLGLL